MCLIAFAWRPGHALPLVVAANRDEFYARPTLELAPWQDAPQIIAGRDLEAGGGWLGITEDGRFAALTNIRAAHQPQGGRSRGELVAGFLRGNDSPAEYLQQVVEHLDDYAGFNLLVGNRDELHLLNAREGRPRRLEAGIYGLSNAELNTPWPKLERARAGLVKLLPQVSVPALLALLEDDWQPPAELLPDTGIDPRWERMLGSIFIRSEDYGTRASTVLLVAADGSFEITERRFGRNGRRLGETGLSRPAL
jgi:uncharacterized protein with NRDE domain